MIRLSLRLMTVLLLGTRAFAQPPAAAPREPGVLGFDYDESLLGDLPTSDTIYTILETIQPSLITDRFTGGGLFTGQPARVGGFLSSWTQTQFTIGDVDITDPTGSGMPLLFPDLGPWRRVQVATGLLSDESSAVGLSIALDPRVRSGRWQHQVDGMTSHGRMASTAPLAPIPASVRLTGRDRLAWSSTGGLADRLNGAFSASWTRAAQAVRTEVSGAEAELFSALATLERTASDGRTWTTLGWVQRASAPFEYRLPWQEPQATTSDTAVHVQSTWGTNPRAQRAWRVFGSFSQRSRTPSVGSSTAMVERLVDGPVSAVADPSRGQIRVGTFGARYAATRASGARTHQWRAGVDGSAARQRTPPSGIRTIGELVDGLAARVWRFTPTEAISSRHAVTLAVHGGDEIVVSPRLRVSLGLRLESVGGDASGAAQGIEWLSLLPNARLWWRTSEEGSTVAFVGYRRSAYRLMLDLLAIGDPAAPTADVYRWLPSQPVVSPGGALVARVGPGTFGRADFSRIDSNLDRPISDELSFGIEMARGAGRRFQIALIGRRESGLPDLVNIGVPVAMYSTFTVNDPGANTGKPDDDKVITVYDRQPSAFGADRYLLTNASRDALSGGLELSGQWTASRLTMMGGATASIAVGPAATRGYGPLENDQSLPGDAFVTPNDATFERGRLFADRAFTVKLAGVYRFPADITLGVIARYQDGQSFSRVLVFPALAQGTEAIRAFAAGDSRFRFTGTLDTRLQKAIASGGRRFAVVLDAYNLLGLTYGVEERAAQQINDRRDFAIQPPRTVHVGIRARF
jgi:hypothetical protein